MAFSQLFPKRFLALIAFCIVLPICFAQANLTSTTSSPASTPTSSTTASIFPGTSTWAYYGCYNETTLSNGTNGLRALNGGVVESLDDMTVEVCLNYCSGNNYAFAGLEYTRECYCAQYLSSISAKLPNSTCSLACAGNSSEICGGNLVLSVYQMKSSKKAGGIKIAKDAPVSSILALGIAMGVLFCLA